VSSFQSAFVTGATGLLGSNLVRALVERGVRVTALARSPEKARAQLGDLPEVGTTSGDMTDVAGFARVLPGHDVLFHTAAHFRDSYKGGSHRDRLMAINVAGTRDLLAAAYGAGIRRMIHTSSIAVLDGKPGQMIGETSLRDEADADDYYLSKIRADREVLSFLSAHPDFHAAMVLPGWMHGPGDAGPTSAGQVVQDFVLGRLAGGVAGAVSVVDARDVAAAQIAAAEQGRRGERYLAAGRHMTTAELFPVLERVSGVKAPTRRLPLSALYGIAAIQEGYARLTGRPVLLSLASVRLMAREGERTRFDHRKSEQELGLRFRPVEETLADEIAWFRSAGLLPPARAGAPGPRKPAPASIAAE